MTTGMPWLPLVLVLAYWSACIVVLAAFASDRESRRCAVVSVIVLLEMSAFFCFYTFKALDLVAQGRMAVGTLEVLSGIHMGLFFLYWVEYGPALASPVILLLRSPWSLEDHMRERQELRLSKVVRSLLRGGLVIDAETRRRPLKALLTSMQCVGVILVGLGAFLWVDNRLDSIVSAQTYHPWGTSAPPYVLAGGAWHYWRFPPS